MTQGFFNFSHDLALACNVENYTAPKNVQAMERDLEALAAFFPQGKVSYNPQAPVWGWDKALVKKLKALGYKDLPTLEQLERIRLLSSRKTAVSVLKNIRKSRPDLPLIGQSWFVESEAELRLRIMAENVAADFEGREFVLKEPLSGSGRGLRFVHSQPTEVQKNWALRCIREQGGVVVEPMYHKIQDFAVEFLVKTDEINYLGLSLFSTNQNSVYSGNIIASQEELWSRLTQSFPKEVFNSLIQALIKELSLHLIGQYQGPVGVDMMIVEEKEKGSKNSPLSTPYPPFLRIHPCVEINLRRTMGELSLHLAPIIAPNRTGFFFLRYDKNPDELKSFVASLDEPNFDVQHRLLSGTTLLTPLEEDTRYIALLSIEDSC